VNRVAVAGLPAAEIATLRRVLLALIENLARDESEPAAAPSRSGRPRP
jgi:hypothetical protein